MASTYSYAQFSFGTATKSSRGQDDFDMLMKSMNAKVKEANIKQAQVHVDRELPYVYQIKENVVYIRAPADSWKQGNVV